MEGTADIDLFLDDPVGRYVVGPCWVRWCATPELFGVLLWGRARAVDMNVLVRALASQLHGLPRHRSLVDASRVEGADATAFEVLSRYFVDNNDLVRERVSRSALVRPPGYAGALVAGFFQVLERPYPVSVFDSVTDALKWLVPDSDPSLVQELAHIHAQVSSVEPFLAALHMLIRTRPCEIDAPMAASETAVSLRTLHRRLKAMGTTFRQELATVRLSEAKRRMLDSADPLTRIALDLGFKSTSHFSAQFRRLVGETPTEWRTRRGSDDY